MDWAEIYQRLRCDRDDVSAWSALEERVRALARKTLRQRGDALIEDVVADACATVVLGLDNARGPETFDGFVLGHLLNARRRVLAFYQTSVIPLGELEVPAPPEREADDQMEEARGILERCLDELPARQRRAVELRYLQDASTATIAADLRVAENNARQIVFRGIARLRQCAQRDRALERNAT
jgi:RNA polymerase sigma factor (sigma-70 family)